MAMFVAAKLLALITQPLAWVIVLLALGLWRQHRQPHRTSRLGLAALGLLLLIGWQPLPDALLRQLEQQHPAVGANADLSRFAGVVLLGGALESARTWQGNDQVALNGAAERMTVPVTLLRQFPQLVLLFSGGEGELLAQGMSEAARAQVFFDSMAVPPGRIRYESESRNTYENAVLSARVAGTDPKQPWLLLTSAWHMPRALASFSRAGWNVSPYPVDFRAGLHTPWWTYSLREGVERWQLALHEWVGYGAYVLTGRL